VNRLRTMEAVRALYATLIATFAVAAAGCGSSDVGVGGGVSPATMLKPGAAVYAEVVSDAGSAEWQQAEELLRRFPDGENWIAELRKSIEGVDWERDVEPALGETTGVAVYPGGKESPEPVLLTSPDDPDKTTALAEKLDRREGSDATVTRVVGDWVVISSSDTAIDRALKRANGGALADDRTFKAAMDKAPDDALVRLYVDPPAALEAFGRRESDARALRLLGFDRLDFAAAWAKAKDTGPELALSAGGEGAAGLLGADRPYSSALLERVPEDALAFVSFQGRPARRQFEAFKDNPLYAMGVRQLERELGIKLQDLFSLSDGEVALYARLALPIPELTLLLESAGSDTGAKAERLLRAFAQREGGKVTEDGDVTTATFDGGFTINLGSVEGIVVLTTSKDAFDALAASGDKLPDRERFKDALAAAGVPDEYTSLAYVDLAEALDLLEVYLRFNLEEQRLPEELAKNLEALKTFVAWGTRDGDISSARAFLGID
jgi:Protein of unknown function (DUF3352)